MQTAGIIGGLGPETTAQFYLEVIFNSFKQNSDQRPPILIWSIPLKYQIEAELIKKAKGEERYLPYLKEAALRLEKGGADFIVIPCNSVHLFIEEIRKTVKIPVLSIIEETAQFLKSKNINQVGLLATKSTVEKKLYQLAFNNNDITIKLPSQIDQESVGNLINNLVINRYDIEDKEELLNIIRNMASMDVNDIVLACTDLQLLTPKYDGVQIYDSMAILAEATVREILQ